MICYPWYEIINERRVLQGDILESFDIIIPIENIDEESCSVDSDVETHDVIVLSHSCDLEEEKVNLVLLCPLTDIDAFKERASGIFRSDKGLEQIRRGLIPGIHMLAECSLEGHHRPIRIVDFHKIFSMPINYVRNVAEQKGARLRLHPPYREHLSQSFARFFMRVGLPVNIPKFK